MKKLKCRECSEIWYVDESDLDKLSVCPFCVVPIWEQKVITEFDTLDKAIYGAIKNMGIDIFQNHRQLSGYLMDMAPNLKKEIRIFTKTINEEYMVYVKNAFEQDERNAEIAINKLKNLFIEDEGLSEKWADMLCESLFGAVLYAKGIGERTIAAEVEDIGFFAEEHQVEVKDSNLTDSLIKNLETKQLIEKKYKCDICGYVMRAETLASDNCPVCKANRWVIESTEESVDVLPNSNNLKKEAKKSEYSSADIEKNINIAQQYVAMRDYNSALEYYRQAANMGYTPAYNSIAEMYHSNGNYKRAWKWYLKSSEIGDSDGEYYVGYYYQEGYHVKKNVNLARKYYEKSAKQNNLKALVALAFQYKNGMGVKKDEKKSADYFELAAQKGSAEAQYCLGICYKEGIGREKDNTIAASWFLRAMGQKYGQAEDMFQKCIADMPLTQRLKLELKKSVIKGE